MVQCILALTLFPIIYCKGWQGLRWIKTVWSSTKYRTYNNRQMSTRLIQVLTKSDH